MTIDGCRVEKLQLRIVKDIAQRYDIIIGRDFTDHSELTYYRFGNGFDLVNSKTFPFSHFPETEVKEVQSVASVVISPTNLPPATTNFIRVKCDKDEVVIPVTNLGRAHIDVKAGQVLETKIKREVVQKLKPRVELVTKNDSAEGIELSDERLQELLQLLNM